MSDDQPVILEGIPVFTGDLALLDTKVTALTKGGAAIATAAGDVHSSFGGLQAFYKAPEAEQLFATTKPVATTAASLKSDLGTITGALSTYSDDAYPLVEKLKELKRDAGAFLVKVNADDKWREDGDLVEENNTRRDRIRETWTAFQAVERACHDKIVALVGGPPLKVDDGSGKKGMYGYDAEALKHAKGLPWGDPVKESTPAWQVWEHAYDFGKGFFVDGVGATIKGLGTLVGFDGWDAMKQAWTGLAQLSTGLVMTVAAGPAFWMTSDDKLPSWLRDSRTAMKETGKALVAWDQWGENPSRAAGTVTFNAITVVFTRGAGSAVAGAGKAGAATKALSFVSKAGRAVDPMTYIFKGAGAGLSKISDVLAGLKGTGTIEIPPLPDNIFTLPEGATRLPDGTVKLPEGATIPDGAVRLPDGTVKLPEGVVALPEGTVKLPEGQASAPEGTVRPPSETPAYWDRDGNLYKADGSILQRAEDAPTESGGPATTASNPRAETPARQPALVGAGAHAGSDIGGGLRLGDNLGDVGRSGTDLPGGGAADRTPGGTAGNMPGNSLGGDTHAGRTGTPGGSSSPMPHGGSGDSIPASAPDNASGGGDHSGASSTGGTAHGVPGNPTVGNGIRGADDAAHRAEYEAAREKPAGNRTPEERAAITREHVRLANQDPAWRAQHYDKWGVGKRNSAEELVDGQLLPKLIEKPDGSWMSANELPYASAEEFHLEDLVRDRATVDPQGLTHLDEVSARRRAGMDLTNAQKAFDSAPTDETVRALTEAQKHFDETAGPGVSNNSKLGEALGEEAARQHMLLLKEFEGAREITDLPETPNGSKRFDQLWRDKDGSLIIVEAKAPNATLDWRQGNGDLDSRTLVRQGTIEYVRTIAADMEQRALFSPKDAKYAAEIWTAIENETLRYVLVQATENTGKYAGAKLRHFKIF